MKIPTDNRWTQTNDGDIFGVLSETECMSFDSIGKMRTARKAFSLFTSDDEENLSDILSINYYDNDYILITDDEAFRISFDAATINITEIPSTPLLNDNSDGVVFNSRHYASTNNNLMYYDGSSWTSSLKSLTSDVPHPLAVFDSENGLAVGNGNQVILMNTSHTTTVTLTIPSQYEVTTMRYRNGYLYIGTKNINGGEAKVFIWSAASTGADYEVPVGSNWVFALTEYGNTVAGVTNQGEIILVNGTQAQQLAAFPVYFDTNAIWDASSSSRFGKIGNRGIATVGDTIYFNVDGELDNGFSPLMKSGIWVFDPQVGLYHKANHSLDTQIEDTNFTVTDSVITTSANHGLKTGDAVQFTRILGLEGVDTNVKYYAKVEGANSLRLALSRKALRNQKYVTISGTPGALDNLVYVTNNDQNASYNTRSGAIGLISSIEAPLQIWESPIIWGARIDDKDGNTKDAVLTFTDSFNISRFTLQRIYSNGAKQTWESLYTFIDGLVNEGEEVTLKAITEENEYSVFQGVWGDTNKIHSNASTFDEDEWGDIEVGVELTLVDGYGRGYSTHVTAIDETTNTFVLTVDENIGTPNQPVYFYYTTAKKLPTATVERRNDWLKTKINTKSTWLKIRGEIRGFETGVTHFELVEKAHTGTT